MPLSERMLSSISKPELVARIALACVLLAAAVQFVQYTTFIWPILPIMRLWSSPDAQYRLQLPDIPYDALRAADATLPRDASILLITSGRDVQQNEYRIFHRALYFLAPRPVWWLTPHAPDGTWKSRWWISAPLDPGSIRRIAAEKQVSYVLAYGLAQPISVGREIADLGDSHLLQLDQRQPLLSFQPGRPTSPSTSWPIRVLLALAAAQALGYSVLLVVARIGYRAHGVEAAALAWAFGVGLISLAMLWLQSMGISLDGQVMLLTSLVLGGLVWRGMQASLRSRLRSAKDLGIRSQRWFAELPLSAKRMLISPGITRRLLLPFILLSFLTLQITYIALGAVGRPLDIWDSWVTWGMKARIIFLDGSISSPVYADLSRAITHLDYPLLVPLIEAWLYNWLGTPDDRLVGLVAIPFYLALAGVCYSASRRWGATRRLGLVVAIAVASIPEITVLSSTVFADVPLALFATIAAIFLIEWLEHGRPGALVVAATAAGLMPWTKREGIILLGALCLATLIVSRGTRRAWFGVGALLLAAVCLSGPWWMFVRWNGIANVDFLPLTMATFQANLGRAPRIAQIELASLLSADWGFAWPIAALVGLVGRRSVPRMPGSAARRAADLLPTTALLYLGLMSPTYIFSAFVPYEGHVLSSAYRLIAHVAPLPVLWIAYRAS